MRRLVWLGVTMAVLAGLGSCKLHPAPQPSNDTAPVPQALGGSCARMEDGACPRFGPKDGGVDCVLTIQGDGDYLYPEPTSICVPQGRQLKFQNGSADIVVTPVSHDPFDDPNMKDKGTDKALKIHGNAGLGRYKYHLRRQGRPLPGARSDGGTVGEPGELEVVPDSPID